MTNTILYNARLLDPATGRDEIGGLVITNSVIADIGTHITSGDHNLNGLCLAPAFVDIDVQPHESESASQLQQRAWQGGVVTWLQQHNTAYVANPNAMLQRLQQQPQVVIQPCVTEFTGIVHDTPAHYRYGLPVLPVLAETLALQRDIALTQHIPHARYHALRLSSAAALNVLPHHAPNISASVSLHHLLLNYIDTVPFRTDTLLNPPLRDETDRLALCEAVIDGVIAVVTSAHTPCYASAKVAPPTQAARGASDIEHLLPAVLTLHHSGGASLLQAIAPITSHPARLFGLNAGTLAIGTPAHATAFCPHTSQRIDRAQHTGTALHGRTFEGMVHHTWQHGALVYSRTPA